MHIMTHLEQRSTVHKSDFWHHPIVVRSIISIEAWERFSFYGMQAILGYYLYYTTSNGGLGLAKSEATALIGAYGALVYLCTFAGGWVGDRVLGAEKTLFLGASLLVIGHLILSLVHPIPGLATGLTLIALGSGFLKTAAITVLGTVYREDSHSDAHRETGFQFFYLGIQVAAVAGPLLTGWLALTYSFHVGFLAAALLMIIGMGVYVALRSRALEEMSEQSRQCVQSPAHPVTRRTALTTTSLGILALIVVVLAVATGIFTAASLAHFLLGITITAAVFLMFTMFRSPHTTWQERHSILHYIPIFCASVAFWAIMNQTYGVLAVYSDVRLNRTIAGFEFPAAWTQSLNPIFVLTLSIPLAYLWAKLGSRGPTAATKISIGVIVGGSGFLVLIPFAGGGPNSTPLLILALSILITAIGELFAGPIGMAATAKHAPASYRTQFSALYFLTMSIGTALAGSISSYYDSESASAERIYFFACGSLAICIGLCTWVAAHKLSKATPNRN